MKGTRAALVIAWGLSLAAARGSPAGEAGVREEVRKHVAVLLDRRKGRERFSALHALQALGPDAAPAVPALVKVMKDPGEPEQDMPGAAIRTLGCVGPAAGKAVPALVARLASRHYGDARRALAEIGEPAVAPLFRALRDRRHDVRWRVCQVLARMELDPKKALPPLAQVFARDPHYTVKAAAAYALGSMGADAAPAVRGLAAAVSDGRPEVWYSAAMALGRIGPRARPAVPALQKRVNPNTNALVRCEAAVALFRILRNQATLALVKREFAGRLLRPQVVERLAEMGADAEPATDVLIGALGDSDSTVRRRAADALGAIGATGKRRAEIVRSLRAAGGHEDKKTVYRVQIALARCGEDPAPAVRYLVRMLAYRDVRDDARVMLVKLGKPAVPALVKSLSNPERHVRWLAARALGRIGPDAKEALPRLQEAYDARDKAAVASWTDAIPVAIERIKGGP